MTLQDTHSVGTRQGDCLNLTSTGEWKLTHGAPVGKGGNITLHGKISGFVETQWHSLELTLMSTFTAGSIDGVQMFNISSDGSSGYIALSSSCKVKFSSCYAVGHNYAHFSAWAR